MASAKNARRPDEVTPSSHKEAWFVCRSCGTEYISKIADRCRPERPELPALQIEKCRRSPNRKLAASSFAGFLCIAFLHRFPPSSSTSFIKPVMLPASSNTA